MQSPKQIYQRDIQQNHYIADPAQQEALEALEKLHYAIIEKRTESVKSVYLWGSVGRGKSYLMDCFYESLKDTASIERMHYYRFMQQLHKQLRDFQGQKDPLKHIAKALALRHNILCLDEFFVSDIGDAMLLGRLLTNLFDQGLIIVTTSNVEPNQLYKDGLQRDRFLPAIKILEKNLQVLQMQGKSDHRLAKAKHSHFYLVEDNWFDHQNLSTSAIFEMFAGHSHDSIEYQVQLAIESRALQCLAINEQQYCFSFEQIFCGPRSANDYIALANLADTFYLVNVPQMGGALKSRKVARGTEDTYNINQRVADRPFIYAKGDDEARRFISFVDEMYDQNKRVVISADVPLNELYLGGGVEFEFERTFSRIVEMQSDNYIKS
jgi:cell division protein ZapE